jgi:hypothetical protein
MKNLQILVKNCNFIFLKFVYKNLNHVNYRGSDSGDSDEDRDLIEICCNRLCNCSSCTKKKKRLKKSASKPNIRNKNERKSPNQFPNIKYQKIKERKKSVTKIKTKPQPSKSKNKSSSNRKSPTGKSNSLPNKIKSSTGVENKLEKHSGWMSMAFGNFSSLKSSKLFSSGSVGGVGKKKKFGGVKYQKLKSGRSKTTSKSKSSKRQKSFSPRSKVKSKKIQEGGSKSRKKSPNILTNDKHPEKKNKLTKSKAKMQKSSKSVSKPAKESQSASTTSKRTQSQFPREKRKPSPTKKSHRDPILDSGLQSSSKSKPKTLQNPNSAELHTTGIGKNKVLSKKSKENREKEYKIEESEMQESPREHFTDHINHDSEECGECQRHEWWQRHTMESFRHAPRYIAASLRDRVDCLNEFYDNMPYPPHCNL